MKFPQFKHVQIKRSATIHPTQCDFYWQLLTPDLIPIASRSSLEALFPIAAQVDELYKAIEFSHLIPVSDTRIFLVKRSRQISFPAEEVFQVTSDYCQAAETFIKAATNINNLHFTLHFETWEQGKLLKDLCFELRYHERMTDSDLPNCNNT